MRDVSSIGYGTLQSLVLFIVLSDYPDNVSVLDVYNTWAKSIGLHLKDKEDGADILEHTRRFLITPKEDLVKALIVDGVITADPVSISKGGSS